MKSATRMALVAAAAYPLGRFRKLRWATRLAAMAMTGQMESPTQMAARGAKQLASSKEFGEITEAVWDRLVDAAVGAATAAATTRLQSITDQLNDQTESLRQHGSKVANIAGGRLPADEQDEDDADDRSDGERRPQGRARSSQRESGAHRRSKGNDDSAGGDPRSRRHDSNSKDSDDGASRSQGRHDRSGAHSGGSPVRRKG